MNRRINPQTNTKSLMITSVFIGLLLSSLFIITEVNAETYNPTYKKTFIRTNDAGQPLPLISSTDKNAYVFRRAYWPMFPCVISVPEGSGYDWLELPDKTAKYLMFYSDHLGDHISSAWAVNLAGPWYPNNNPKAGTDNHAIIKLKPGWEHMSSPDVYIDSLQKRIVMHFNAGDGHNYVATVATSKSGFYFENFIPSGSDGTGIHSVTINGKTRPVYTGPVYGRTFFYDSDNDGVKELYSLGKRGEIAKAPADNPDTKINEQFANTIKKFSLIWKFQKGKIEQNYKFAASDKIRSELRKPLEWVGSIGEFMRSKEFLTHPNNPHPGHYIASVGGSTKEPVEQGPGWINHMDVEIGDFDYDGVEDELEVYFYANRDTDEKYNHLFRVVMDLKDRRTAAEKSAGDDAFHSWVMERDSAGVTMFEVIFAPIDIINEKYPKGVPLGDPNIFIDKDGTKYLFFSYGPEGSITAAKLEPIYSAPVDTSTRLSTLQMGNVLPIAITAAGISIQNENAMDITVKILDIRGKIVYNNSGTSKMNIDTTPFLSGTYILNLEFKGVKILTKKFTRYF